MFSWAKNLFYNSQLMWVKRQEAEVPRDGSRWEITLRDMMKTPAPGISFWDLPIWITLPLNMDSSLADCHDVFFIRQERTFSKLSVLYKLPLLASFLSRFLFFWLLVFISWTKCWC